jgi:D-threo-aldose 1-dehydrogenase
MTHNNGTPFAGEDHARAAPRTLGPDGPVVSRLCLGTSSWSRERFGAGPVEALELVLDANTRASAGPAESVGGGVATDTHAASADESQDSSQVDVAALTFIDTSNEYGGQASESFIGDAIRRRGGLPAGVVLQTKLDRDLETGSFSSDRMWRSLLESTARLGIDRLPMLYLHDPERISWDEAFAEDGPVRALVEMKERGLVDQIGISGGPAPMLQRYVETGLFTAVITHNRYTLVDRSSEQLLDVSAERGVRVVNAAVLGGGALARWPEEATQYAYRPTSTEMRRSIALMGEACQRAGVTLSAAALQFSTRDPRVVSTIVGGNSPEQVRSALADDAVHIPAELWAELETLVPDASVWQEPPGSVWP